MATIRSAITGYDYFIQTWEPAALDRLRETITTPAHRESVPLKDILASAPGPELDGLPGLTTEESGAYIKAMES